MNTLFATVSLPRNYGHDEGKTNGELYLCLSSVAAVDRFEEVTDGQLTGIDLWRSRSRLDIAVTSPAHTVTITGRPFETYPARSRSVFDRHKPPIHTYRSRQTVLDLVGQNLHTCIILLYWQRI